MSRFLSLLVEFINLHPASYWPWVTFTQGLNLLSTVSTVQWLVCYMSGRNNQLAIYRSGKYHRSLKAWLPGNKLNCFICCRPITTAANWPLMGHTGSYKNIFHWESFFLQSWFLFSNWFLEMKIQRVLENNTNPFACSKSDGTGSIIIPSENLKGQGKASLLNFEYGAP